MRFFKGTYPLPRPATYEAGAGMDKNASLLGLLDAIFDLQKGSQSIVVAVQSKALSSRVTPLQLNRRDICGLAYRRMSAITRNLPWFIKDLGLSIIGEVKCFTRLSLYLFINTRNHKSGMLHLPHRDLRCQRRKMPQILSFKGSRYWNCIWRIYYEGPTDSSQ